MKKAQINNPIFAFVAIVIGLLIFAPIVLKVFISIQTPISDGISNVNGGTEAASGWNAVMTPLTTMWDKVMIFAFITTTLVLFVSAFFIDTHPVWVILYIMSCFFLVLVMPGLNNLADQIYESSSFSSEVALLPFMDSLRSHYMAWMLGVMVISGIIMYGKFGFFNSGNSGNPRGGSFR